MIVGPLGSAASCVICTKCMTFSILDVSCQLKKKLNIWCVPHNQRITWTFFLKTRISFTTLVLILEVLILLQHDRINKAMLLIVVFSVTFNNIMLLMRHILMLYEKKVQTVVVNNPINTKQPNNHCLSPQFIELSKDHNIWRWKSRFWFGTDTKMWRD